MVAAASAARFLSRRLLASPRGSGPSIGQRSRYPSISSSVHEGSLGPVIRPAGNPWYLILRLGCAQLLSVLHPVRSRNLNQPLDKRGIPRFGHRIGRPSTSMSAACHDAIFLGIKVIRAGTTFRLAVWPRLAAPALPLVQTRFFAGWCPHQD